MYTRKTKRELDMFEDLEVTAYESLIRKWYVSPVPLRVEYQAGDQGHRAYVELTDLSPWMKDPDHRVFDGLTVREAREKGMMCDLQLRMESTYFSSFWQGPFRNTNQEVRYQFCRFALILEIARAGKWDARGVENGLSRCIWEGRIAMPDDMFDVVLFDLVTR